MSKKDYVVLAHAIFSTKLSTREVLGAGSVLKLVTDRIATELEIDNPQFDRELFVKACGFPVAS
jgi:hypothetical protein